MAKTFFIIQSCPWPDEIAKLLESEIRSSVLTMNLENNFRVRISREGIKYLNFLFESS